MPVLEAMAAGLPVVAANRSALPEVCGSAALLVDPEDVDAIHAAINQLMRDERLAADLTRRGLARANEFTWEKSAEQTWKAYQRVLG
jgi:glycosyltransferase involved in cell wall biosynthesis